jgi:hypothetical protein
MRRVLICGFLCAFPFGSLLGCGGEDSSTEGAQGTGRVPAGGVGSTAASMEEKKAAMKAGMKNAVKTGGRAPGRAGQ